MSDRRRLEFMSDSMSECMSDNRMSEFMSEG